MGTGVVIVRGRKGVYEVVQERPLPLYSKKHLQDHLSMLVEPLGTGTEEGALIEVRPRGAQKTARKVSKPNVVTPVDAFYDTRMSAYGYQTCT